jgi:hypothetical protein
MYVLFLGKIQDNEKTPHKERHKSGNRRTSFLEASAEAE